MPARFQLSLRLLNNIACSLQSLHRYPQCLNLDQEPTLDPDPDPDTDLDLLIPLLDSDLDLEQDLELNLDQDQYHGLGTTLLINIISVLLGECVSTERSQQVRQD